MAFVTSEQLDKEADAMLDAMYSDTPAEDDSGNDQPVEPTNDTVDASAAAKAEQTQTPRPQDERDPLEIANERVANAQRKMTEATQEAASLRKQVAELQQKLAQIQESHSKQTSSNSENITTLEALSAEYPDLIAPVINEIRTLREQVNQVGERFDNEAKTKQQEQEEKAMKAHMDAILSSHPDALEVSQSIDFQVWLDGMPPMYRQSINQGTAQDVVNVLDAFKGNATQNNPSTKLEQAKKVASPNPRSVVQKSSKPTYTRDQIRNMSPSEFMEHETAIDDAYRDGRVI